MKSRLMVFLATLGGAVLFGAAGYALGALLGRLTGGGMADLALGVAGMTLGLMLGSSLGASWMARRENRQRKAWVFWLVGVGTVLLVFLSVEPLRLNQSTPALLVALFGLPAPAEAVAA